MARATDERRARRLARGLGWVSLGLGAVQVAAPGRFARAIGVGGSTNAATLVRLVGARELATGAGLLAGRRPGRWLWARTGGDALDLALLAAALRGSVADRRRAATALAGVVGVAVPDVLGALASRDEPGAEPREVRTAITIARPPEEVYACWRDLERLPSFMRHLESVEARADGTSRWTAKAPIGTVAWEAEIVEDVPNERVSWRSLPGGGLRTSGTVRFVAAPGGRGTEVHLELRHDAHGGPLATTIAKLLGEEPTQQAKDDLRRLKQVLETGEVVRSEATPEGVDAARLLRQRPARPLEEAAPR